MRRNTLGRKVFKGRGTLSNPPGRFERQDVEEVHDGWYEEDQPDTIATTIEPDRGRGIITRNDSPDVPFEQSINPYRGCEHGCVYCYARPSHAFMGLSSGIDFQTRLFYKANAGQVLEEELAKPGYVCKPITIGANTDPYQPIGREMKVTRSVLEVLARTRHPASIITKSALVLRDRRCPVGGLTLVRLPYEIKDLFRDWPTEHFPDRAARVMSLIRDMRVASITIRNLARGCAARGRSLSYCAVASRWRAGGSASIRAGASRRIGHSYSSRPSRRAPSYDWGSRDLCGNQRFEA